jgi:integrase
MLNYAVANELIPHNPLGDTKGLLPKIEHKHMAAPTDPKDVAPLMRAIDGFSGSIIVKVAMQLSPLLFCRPGELRHMEWSELNFDTAEWNIPAVKMKMRQPHLVPLATQVIVLLKELQPLTGHAKYVFPSHRSPLRCISDNTINAGLRRLGFEKTEITAHGFRAMARTILDEVLHFRPDIIEHQLAHAVRDPLGRVYNRTSHLAERKQINIPGLWLLDAVASPSKKTAESGSLEAVASEQIDTGERVFCLNMVFLELWPLRCCSLRSSERWRRRQRLRGMPSLPDIRHQISKLLIRQLRC